jgi:hypothetical protein
MKGLLYGGNVRWVYALVCEGCQEIIADPQPARGVLVVPTRLSKPHSPMRPARLASAASATGRLSGLPGGLEPGTDLLGLLEVLVGRAPEEQASGYAPDGYRHVELDCDAANPVLHRRQARAVRERHADRLIRERLHPRPEFLIELRVHAGAAAHGASFCQRDVFEVDGCRLLGHERSLFSIHCEVQR